MITNLNILLNSNVEVVSKNLIQKLYEITSDNGFQRGDLAGNLQAPHCTQNAYNYLLGNISPGVKRFPGLSINITDGIYIDFVDTNLESLLKRYIGDSDGVIQSDILNFNAYFGATYLNTHTNRNDKFCLSNDERATLISFDEFQYFTSVTRIASSAFEEATNLTSITFPPNISYIELRAFKSCNNCTFTNLESILNNLTYVGHRAFQDCSKIEIEELSVPNLTYLGNGFFAGTKIKKITNLGNITSTGNNSSSIDSMFAECSELTEVTLPSTITELSEQVFRNTPKLTKVNLENIVSFKLGQGSPFNNSGLKIYNYLNYISYGESIGDTSDPFPNNSFRRLGNTNPLTGQYATDLYLPKVKIIPGGKDDEGRLYNGWFSGNGWWRKSLNNNYGAYNIIYLRDVTTVTKGAFCGADIINLVINSNQVPNVIDNTTGFMYNITSISGKLFEGNHVIQHIYVKPELVNDFKNHLYWGEKASVIESIENCPRKTEEEVRNGQVGLIEVWM